ncbi:hypothetical protein HY642_02600, partial [Candidatus Woesearchaeota archaeon]|nr:hypothetical protein [Candidatus Woesearchaeota archaeon]
MFFTHLTWEPCTPKQLPSHLAEKYAPYDIPAPHLDIKCENRNRKLYRGKLETPAAPEIAYYKAGNNKPLVMISPMLSDDKGPLERVAETLAKQGYSSLLMYPCGQILDGER